MNYTHVESPQAIFNGSDFNVLKTEYTIKSYLITSGARLYHPLSEKVSIYTGIQTLVGKGTLETNNPIPNFLNSDTFDFEASLRHGISYQVSPSILLSASTSSVYFFFSRTTPDDSDLDLDETDFGLDNFGSLGLSVAYKF